eukprot:TRINITY_DN2911_c0_g1_i1.p1 TRINITY_DN2911_c0_g1~~TRINITY_DN2911_c0_g1_i1.p1  ORF type:complete len:406 (-),score=87.94 TRINITY_DN2911_c0_g1_i1:27-1244(-)
MDLNISSSGFARCIRLHQCPIPKTRRQNPNSQKAFCHSVLRPSLQQNKDKTSIKISRFLLFTGKRVFPRLAKKCRVSEASNPLEPGNVGQKGAEGFLYELDERKMEADETFGEVERIMGSRAVGNRMQYLIEWKDGHIPTWVPSENIAKDVVEDYEGPWWTAIKKADEKLLTELLKDLERDVDAVDENGRTGLLFASALGHLNCIRLLADAGANIDKQDVDGLSPLHMAAGYMKPEAVKLLLELGAETELRDSKGRTPLDLAKQLLQGIPKGNPLHIARRMGLESVVKVLEDAGFEIVEVDQIVDKRTGPDGQAEYLVKWKDGQADEWLPAGFIGEDLVEDFEAGLEYGVAEKILDKQEEDGALRYLVKWADIEVPTWEPPENLDAELVAEFESARRGDQQVESA